MKVKLVSTDLNKVYLSSDWVINKYILHMHAGVLDMYF